MELQSLIMSRQIIFGPRAPKSLAHTGGIVVLFELYIDYLNSNCENFIIVDTNSKNYKSKLEYIVSVYSWLIKSRNYSIIEIHATARDIFAFLIPLQIIVGKQSKVVVRKFAGNFHDWYQNRSFFSRKVIIHCLRRVDLLFFETKYLISFFSRFEIVAAWWPNVRKGCEEFDLSKRKKFRGKLLFLSQVKLSKGVLDAILCAKGLPENFTLDIYGPIVESGILDGLENTTKISYHGIVNPKEVHLVMSNYDLLLFPSMHEGEGYPGVIIEAKSVGLPSICYNHGGVSEIVEDGLDGFVISKGNVEGMIKRIKDLSHSEIKKLSINSFRSFKKFDAEIVHQQVVNKVLQMSN